MAIPNAGAFVKQPAGYLAREPIAGAILVWLVLVSLSSFKRGALPTQREAVAIGAATAVIAVVAAFAPRIVVLFLLATAVIMTVRNASAISDLVDTGFGRLQSAVGA